MRCGVHARQYKRRNAGKLPLSEQLAYLKDIATRRGMREASKALRVLASDGACDDCRHYWRRKAACSSELNPRVWYEPSVAPPWCPGFEPLVVWDNAGAKDDP